MYPVKFSHSVELFLEAMFDKTNSANAAGVVFCSGFKPFVNSIFLQHNHIVT